MAQTSPTSSRELMSLSGLQSDGDMEDDDFSFLQPLDLITKDASELHKIIREKRENLQKDKAETNEKKNECKQVNEPEHPPEREEEKKGRENEQEHDKEMTDKDREEEICKDKELAHPDHGVMDISDDKVIGKHEEIGDCGGNVKVFHSLQIYLWNLVITRKFIILFFLMNCYLWNELSNEMEWRFQSLVRLKHQIDVGLE